MSTNLLTLNNEQNMRSMMADAKFFEAYSRWDDEKDRYETWNESVERVMNMHRGFYADKMTEELSGLIDEVEAAYKEKLVLGSQRALQFGGDQLLKHHIKLYNCSSSYIDRPEYFGEFFYVLLGGCGVGIHASNEHVSKLPEITPRTKQAKIHVIDDSIEGWSTSVDVLMSSYFVGGGKHPEYEGRRVFFDTSTIRPKGAHISGGFKAPGPEPLRLALDKIEHLLQSLVLSGVSRLRPIHVFDISMFIADAVLSGGIRRAAVLTLFDIDDEEMMKAKTGDWYMTNPQRGRSNNSAIIIRDKTTREQFDNLFSSTQQFGEPGFVFFDDNYTAGNPCMEVGMVPSFEGESGFQGCNLTEINGGQCDKVEDFIRACRAASILGTLQAGYTDFKFLSETTRKIFEREALLGVSITGWMNNPGVLFDDKILREGAQLVIDTNEYVAKMIGINPAARSTVVKPSGTASILIETTSGIHAEHSPLYIRNMQMNKDTEVAQLIKQINPYMVEESQWSATGSDYVISFPVISPPQSIYRDDLLGVNLLEKVKLVQENWIEYGTRKEGNIHPKVRHNVSNTINVKPDQWEEVKEYLWDNRNIFAGVSLLSHTGDYDYAQAPMTSIMTEDQVVEEFGRGAIFASGLIVAANKGFKNLWEATMIAQMDADTGDKELVDLRASWIRKFRAYADNYFDGDVKRAEYCLKSVHLLHKWTKIQQNFTSIDFVEMLEEKRYTDIDTMAGAACSGGGCEL